MAATDPMVLIAEAKCLNCYGTGDLGTLIRLSILVRVLNQLNPMAATDIQSLLEYAKCFSCYGQLSLSQMIELALLDQINQGVTTLLATPACCVTPGPVDPNGAITGNPGATYYSTASNSFWVKLTGVGNTGWTQVVGGTAGQVGIADPEGSVVATPGTTYWATGTGTFWVKQTGVGNVGWVQLI